jgi:starch synthase
MLITGIDWKFFNWHQMEFFGDLNLMKTGIVFADWITTVSPTYAEEIQTAELGCGLEGALRHRRDHLTGILNGVDYAIWDPAHDPHLLSNYTADNWQDGKSRCKSALQQEVGLPERDDVPLVGFVGRLDSQKGLDLIRTVIEQRVEHEETQYVILGSGHPDYETFLRNIATQHPQKVAVRFEFSNPLAHRIEAGCDMFLMPSRYEPCGLNQMYSLKYGTVPIVRSTGGLADTIVDCQQQTLAERTANGFSFHHYDSEALHQALGRALEAYCDDATWGQLVETGMRQDWSWSQSAARYAKLYETVLAKKRQQTRV